MHRNILSSPLLLTLVALAAPGMLPSADAAELDQAVRGCNFGGGWTFQQGTEAAPTLMACDLDSSFGSAVSVQRVLASTQGPAEDGSGALASASTRVVGDFGRAEGTASLSFALAVRPFAVAPFAPAVLPVTLSVSVFTSVDRWSTATASATLDGAPLVVGLWPGDSGNGLDRSFSIDMRPGQSVRIGKSANCSTRVSGSPDAVVAECSIGIDPVPSFDQARFDATWGTASFDLASHYRFDAGLPTPVPEPASWALALLGAGLLATMARRQVIRTARTKA